MRGDNTVFDVILDFDGPILEGRQRHYECYSRILRRHGRKTLSQDDYWAMKRAATNRHTQLQATESDDLYSIFHDEWIATIESQDLLSLDQLQPGAKGALHFLAARGHRLFLATARRDRQLLFKQLTDLGIDQLFTEVAVVNPLADVADSKVRAIRAIFEPQPRGVFIGDTEADIAAARALGCRAIAVSCGIRNTEFLTKLAPDELHSSLSAWVSAHFAV